MTNTKIGVIVCNNCGAGVFLRCGGDVRSCSCEYLTMSDNGVETVDSETNYKVFHDVELRKSVEDLKADFEECNDKFGVFKDGLRMVAHLSIPNRNIVKSVRRRFDEDESGMLSLDV